MRVVLIHGSVANGPATWPSIEPLRERFDVVLPSRGGYPPGPLLDHIDFDTQAEELAPLLEDGAHLVGHSYGGVISLLIAAYLFVGFYLAVIASVSRINPLWLLLPGGVLGFAGIV